MICVRRLKYKRFLDNYRLVMYNKIFGTACICYGHNKLVGMEIK